MKVLVIGGGGREHALCWGLSQSNRVENIYCAPGNAGISDIAECIDIKAEDIDSLIDFARYEWIDLTVVGPEAPLSLGIADAFEREGLKIFGPSKAAAQIEGSKVFSKNFMRRYGIPTAEYKTFTSYLHAEEYIRLKGAPIVIKADGLAAGKGVIVAKRVEEALDALRLIMKDRIFGNAGDRVVVEQCLEGEEASFMAMTDGKTVLPLATSQDHKRVFDGDEGPNTGGMGAYSPAPVITDALEMEVIQRIMLPAIKGFSKEGIPYKGILYAGLMVVNNRPYVLEFNCRFGDPEAQPVIARLKTGLFDLIEACVEGRLNDIDIRWKPEASLCVVLASRGYPGSYEKGKRIDGLEAVNEMQDVFVFHSGTSFNNDDMVTSGGRVLGVTALGRDISEAKQRAYAAIKKIHFDGMHYRRDIGDKAIKGQQQ